MSPTYLVRYGLPRHVGRFAAEAPLPDPARGLAVVVRTIRGLEVGEVLAARPVPDDLPASTPRILRLATPDDLDRALRAGGLGPERYAAIEPIFRAGSWPIDLIDAEPLPDLDDQAGRVVLHYLGPHRLDAAGLVAAIREAPGLDVAFEPAGLDLDPETAEAEPVAPDDAEACGSGGCGSCGAGGGCGSSAGGCGSCAVKALAARRRPEPA